MIEYAVTFDFTRSQIEEFGEAFYLFDETGEGYIRPQQLLLVLRALGQCPTQADMALSNNEATNNNSDDRSHLPGAKRVGPLVVDGRIGFRAFLAAMATRMKDYDGSICSICGAQWSQLPSRCDVTDAYECRYLDAMGLCCVFADYLGVRYETDTVPLSHALAVICGKTGSSLRGELLLEPDLLADLLAPDVLAEATSRAKQLQSFVMALPRDSAEKIRKHILPAICFFAGMRSRFAASGSMPFFLRDLS